jgi:hypothetical protein
LTVEEREESRENNIIDEKAMAVGGEIKERK